jgi:hypothetical protein
MKLNFFILSIIILISIAVCQFENMAPEEMTKKTKVLGCIAITKARMTQDSVKIILNLVFH